jgi:hypothetical protein
MAKEVKGWRDPQSWDYSGGDVTVRAVSELCRSDDGWVCPHCETKETLEGAEMATQTVMNLIFSGESVREYCNYCGKEYFVRCYKRLTYMSCADEKFEEE